MLILTRKPGESLYIGDNVKITIVEIKGHQIRVGIDAPPELRIYREEIYLQILEENRSAAQAALSSSEVGLDSLTSAWAGRSHGAVPEKGPDKKGLAAFTTRRSGEGDPQSVIRKKRRGLPGQRDEGEGNS